MAGALNLLLDNDFHASVRGSSSSAISHFRLEDFGDTDLSSYRFAKSTFHVNHASGASFELETWRNDCLKSDPHLLVLGLGAVIEPVDILAASPITGITE
jgi:hypothetical protein